MREADEEVRPPAPEEIPGMHKKIAFTHIAIRAILSRLGGPL